MEVKVLEEKVQKAQEKVAKCQATIERHNKSLDKKLKNVAKLGVTLENLKEKREEFRGTDQSWELYEVERKLEDIKGATKKKAEAEQILKNWEAKLTTEINKENFINNEIPLVIVEFLENWFDKAVLWHLKRYDAYQEFSKELDNQVKEAKKQIGVKEGMMTSRAQDKILKEMGLDYKTVAEKKANFAGHTVIEMCRFRNQKDREDYLEKVLEAEKKRKLLDLVYRIKDVVGEITDARGLEINRRLNLDGIVIGNAGKAKVQTVEAGGWNIQCFHYRTLVNPIKGGK